MKFYVAKLDDDGNVIMGWNGRRFITGAYQSVRTLKRYGMAHLPPGRYVVETLDPYNIYRAPIARVVIER